MTEILDVENSLHSLGEFVRVDLERMYEHQERNVKSLSDRVDSTIEAKLQNRIVQRIFLLGSCIFSSSALTIENGRATTRTSSK
jgi:hypothetical protein